jgi:hypothetical protein
VCAADGLLLTLYATGLQASLPQARVRVLIGNQSFVPERVEPSLVLTGVDVVRVRIPRQGCVSSDCSRVEIGNLTVTVEKLGIKQSSNAVTVAEDVK